MRHIISEKIISDPIKGIINIRPILPIIEQNRRFESLNYKYQLGLAYLIFPSATHTRRAHSFGAYWTTIQSTTRLVELGMINDEEAKALCAFALLHDIGHFPFSHITEALVPFDHDEYGRKIVPEMKGQIEKSGVNFNLFKSIFDHKNPLYLIVHDKNLGTEKLDYLERDGYFTILSRPPGIQYLQRHVYFLENDLIIDEKVIDHARDIQDFYIKMYKGVYLRKGALIAQRMMQKLVYEAIIARDISVKGLVDLNDFQLLGILSRSKSQTVKYLFDLLMKRSLFREAIVLRYKNFVFAEKIGDKSIKVLGIEDEKMNKINSSEKLSEKNQKQLKILEESIARLLKIKSQDVLVAPMLNPGKFKTKDIKILTSNQKISSLKKDHPAHFLDIEETIKTYAAFRICTQEKYREKMAKKGEEIKELILNFIS